MRNILLVIAFLIPLSCVSQSIDLCCWIVGDNQGKRSFTAEAVTNLVKDVNRIYRQVVMRFEIASISYTNNTYLSDLVYTNAAQRSAICNLPNKSGGLKICFIRLIDDERTMAFHTDSGIAIGPSANGRSIAHEIGHAYGLSDIYVTYTNVSLRVEGFPSKDRMPNDWGWYPSDVTQADVICRLLMYGQKSDSKADISCGDIYGLRYTNSWNRLERRWDRHFFLGLAPIGFIGNGD